MRAGRVGPTRPKQIVLGRTRRVHFVGIGGSGMSGLAEVVMGLGHVVSGSDAKPSQATNHLARLGARVHVGHDAGFVGDADLLVVSAAVPLSNVEIVEARRRQIPIVPRADMLAELMRSRYGIAVAGAHGKTSTTAMIALVLERAGLDPTAVIGGRLSAFGSSARLGQGRYMVAEADESDRTFLKLAPTLAVITNIDHEHLETFGSFEEVRHAFLDFANNVPSDGAVVVCADDPYLRELLPQITRRVMTYGLETKNADLTAEEVQLEPFGVRCRVLSHPPRAGAEASTPLHLHVPGRHSLLNALAAVAVGLELGVSLSQVAHTLAEFRGADRRFQRIGEVRGVVVVDDYGHHPTEIEAVLAAARTGLHRRVILAFQPHRYTRTRDLLAQFGRSLAGADEVVLTDVYGAGEAPIPGATVDALAEAIGRVSSTPVHVVKPLDRVAPVVAALARPGDLVVTLGAGSIETVAPRIVEALERRHPAAGTPNQEPTHTTET